MSDRRRTARPLAAATIRFSALALMLATLPACASSSSDDQSTTDSQMPTSASQMSASPNAGTADSAPASKPGSDEPSARDLTDTEWKLRAASLNSIDLAKFKITIEFTADEVSGFAGVNRYMGSYETASDGTIKFGPLATTKMAGTPEAMAAEAAYLRALEAANHYSADKSELTLVDPLGVTLEYKAAK